MKISGKQLAERVYVGIQQKISRLKNESIHPQLVIVKSGNVASVNNYVKQKIQKGEKIGIKVKLLTWDDSILVDNKALKQMILLMNQSKAVHGLIFQKPGDERIDETIENLIDPLKDVDGFLPNSRHEPPTFRGVKLVLQQIFKRSLPRNQNVQELRGLLNSLRKKQIVIVGKGKTGGGPIINGLLKNKVPKKNIKVIDSKTSVNDRRSMTETADIVVSAVGKADPVDYHFFSKKTILIDIGVHFDKDNKIKGDFDEEDIKDRVGYYTTTPGGIGALTVAFLMDNVVNAALKTIKN